MTKKQEINPWGNELVVDYEKLFDEFGLEHFPDEVHALLADSKNFRRGVVFAHRGFREFLKAVEEKKECAVMTGIKPSNDFHLGSKMTAEEIVFLQKKFGSKVFYCIADLEALADNELSLEKSRENAVDNVADLLALGLDEKNAFVYRQSECLNVLRLAHEVASKTTFSTLKAIYGQREPGIYASVFVQVGDILQPQLKEFGGLKQVVVPVGVDQDPHIRFSRDVADKLNLFSPSATFHRFFRALDGQSKMSKRNPLSVLLLSDSDEVVKKKIANAFTGGRATVEEQRKKGAEYGKCVVAELDLIHFEEDDKKVGERKRKCLGGEILCGECKKEVCEKIVRFLSKHQERKKKSLSKASKLVLG